MVRTSLVILLSLPNLASAATLAVGAGQPYASIQAAIDSAVDGDRIEVDAGTYTETLDISVDIELIGLSGAGSTVLNGTNPLMIRIDGAEVTLEGFSLDSTAQRGIEILGSSIVTADDISIVGYTLFGFEAAAMMVLDSEATFTNSVFDGHFASDQGGAVVVRDSIASFTSCSFNGNETDQDGGAVGLYNSDVTLDSCSFDQNFANDDGGALDIDDGSDVTLLNSVFTNNEGSDAGGAITSEDGGLLTVENCVFIDNETPANGGAIRSRRGIDLVVTGGIFQGNFTDEAGGAINMDGGDLTITSAVFEQNISDNDGGAIRHIDGNLILTDASFDANIAGGVGGAVRMDDGDLTITSAVFEQNISDNDGGAISHIDGNLILTDASFDANIAGGVGGAVRMDGTHTATIDSTSFSNNQGTFGGALYFREDTQVDLSTSSFELNLSSTGRGGAIRWFPSSGFLNASGNQFTSNIATTTGGAISAASSAGYGDAGEMSLLSNTFIGNEALDHGGGVYAVSVDAVEVVGNTFCNNFAVNNGGASVVESGTGTNNTWNNNVFADNLAGGNGGAIRFEQTSDPDLLNNTFLGNNSADGGHLRVALTSANLTNNIFAFAAGGNGVSQTNNNGNRDYNLWFNNTNNDVAGSLAAGDLGGNSLFVDPQMADYSGDCFNDDYTLQGGSPAIDGGDPGILDVDGSGSDIGAYGGPNAPIDDDGDGFTAVVDCDDTDPNVNPGETEICDGVDNDCDGTIDGASATDAGIWYPDLDGDGVGDGDAPLRECNPPTDYVALAGDCDDDDATVYEGAYEACDGVDNDCDGELDEDHTLGTYYADRDGDGYGDIDSTISACAAPDGYVENTDDCNDFEPLAWTNNTESCDEVDNDCDGEIDEGALITWYTDADGDGYGVDDGDTFEACDGGEGYADNATDCDDTESTVNPGAEEICDALDNDCDTEINEDLITPWYEDADEDGYGNDEVVVDDCEEPNGYTAEGGDCDDSDPFINPGAEDDSRDQIDQDCDDVDGSKFAEEGLKVTPDCGCDATTTGNSVAWWVVLMATVLGFRRRR